MATIDKNEPVRIKTNGLLPSEIELEPPHIREQTLTPDLIHTLSILAGYDGSHEHVAHVDATGKLWVSSGVTAITEYESSKASYDSTTPSAANLTFTKVVSSLDLHIEDYNIKIQLVSSLNDSLGDVIELPVGDVSLPYTTPGMSIWCAVSGSSSTVQVVGWR